ncbi:PAS domain-containing protein [Pseudomonas yamanorum]|uniref:PAS domain-containing protein n=1 Tax=Pseudomonas yamanorum TaxID=515393 RepID=UPI003D36A187
MPRAIQPIAVALGLPLWAGFFFFRDLSVMSAPHTSSDNAVLICRPDLQGRITHSSDAFIKLSGYTRQELLQQSSSFLKHPDMPAHVFSSLWSSLQQRKPWMGLLKNRRKDGTSYWLNVYIKPVFGADGIQAYGAVYSSPSHVQTARAESSIHG